jgi:predicted amidohydrolase
MSEYLRDYDFTEPLDELWEIFPDDTWSFTPTPGQARLENRADSPAEVYLRPCAMPGDRVELRLTSGTSRRGRFVFGFLTGFEHIRFEIDLDSGDVAAHTHEYHKAQPRLATTVNARFDSITLVTEVDSLPGLPFDGWRVAVLLDNKQVAEVGQIDFLPESHCFFGFDGPGELTLASWSIAGGPRPRPEYVNVGVWQHRRPNTHDSVDSLIRGVRLAAEAGVEILATAETSLTGLRDTDPELDDSELIRSELDRFCRAVAATPGAPYTLIGYPDWISGDTVEGATLEHVKINRHVFVRPNGTLGPPMAKVHSCERGMWHGRHYNLQRVCGVEVAVGVCHDARYQDVWATGVMGGARLCIHAAAVGTPKGRIDDIRLSNTIAHEFGMGAFWMHVNSDGGSAIYYPQTTAKMKERIIVATQDITAENPSYPDYSPMDDQLAHSRIRLYDASGCYPLRTLRAGTDAYNTWSSLIPDIVDV